jgi:predicted nuclease of predicted toxin-antitoxin system
LCEYAADHGFVLCSKDDDFHRLVAARGYRPELVHLALGNSGNDQVLAALLSVVGRLDAALADASVGVVAVVVAE